MSLSFCLSFALKIILFGQIAGIPLSTINDIKTVCEIQSTTYQSLDRILGQQESFEDCGYSDGFHLTGNFCKDLIGYQPKFRRLTAYHTTDNHIVLFVNLEIILKGSDRILNLESIRRLRSISNMSTLTVIWIKVLTDIFDSSQIYEIRYRSKSGNNKTIQTSDLKQSLRNDEQIILDVMTTTQNNQEFSVTPANNQIPTESYSIDDSYIILCLVSDKKKTSNCSPVRIHNHGIGCQCDVKNQLTTLVIWCVFLLVFFCLAIKPLSRLLSNAKPTKGKVKEGQTDFLQMVNCNPKTVKYEYILILRLAKGSADFDLTDVNIDIEFKTIGHQSVGPALRFKANVLDKQLVPQIKIFMWRLTKLPELKTVQCSHSGKKGGVITLFSVNVLCKTDLNEFRTYNINKSIVREIREFPVVKEDINGSNLVDEEEIPSKLLTNFKINYSFLEFIWILFVNISLIGFTAKILEMFAISHESPFDTYEMMAAIEISSLVAIVFNILLIQMYKCLLFTELKQNWKTNSTDENFFLLIRRIVYIVTIGVSVGFGIFVSVRSMSSTTLQTYEWFCVTLCATSLFLMVWSIGYHYYSIYLIFKCKKIEAQDSTSITEDISINSESKSESNLGKTDSME